MTVDYGTAQLRRHDDGRVVVIRADETIGVSLGLLAEEASGLFTDEAGNILLAGDPAYRYRPVRFEALYPGGQPTVLVCERVAVEVGEGVG